MYVNGEGSENAMYMKVMNTLMFPRVTVSIHCHSQSVTLFTVAGLLVICQNEDRWVLSSQH